MAIKIPRHDQVNHEDSVLFLREARAAAQLRHPNIVAVHEVGRDGDTLYIVSDFVRGVTLADRHSFNATDRMFAAVAAKHPSRLL